MDQVPVCSSCGRPLQKNRETCLYCGHELSKKERDTVESYFTNERVQNQIEQAEALLEGALPKPFTTTGKLIAKIVVTLLAIGVTVLISWAGEWHPVVIAITAIFFSLPVWQVFRKL